MSKKAVILLSGGMDSTTCLAVALDAGYECYTLSFDYGQKQRAELNAAEKISRQQGAAEHRLVTLSIGDFGGSALTDSQLTVPDHNEDSKEIPITYVPARNTVFLSIALGWAEVIDAEAIFIGVSAVDYSGYPDCRPEYIAAFQNMANLATKNGVEGKPIKIITPLITLSKAQTIELGTRLGVNYEQTVTCYQANKNGFACGHCDACCLRKKGFSDAGFNDVTHYQ